MYLLNVPASQTAGAWQVRRHRGAWKRAMGAGFVSSDLLVVMLLQHLEKCQILWKGTERKCKHGVITSNSILTKVIQGVPQGPVFGPLLVTKTGFFSGNIIRKQFQMLWGQQSKPLLTIIINHNL